MFPDSFYLHVEGESWFLFIAPLLVAPLWGRKAEVTAERSPEWFLHGPDLIASRLPVDVFGSPLETFPVNLPQQSGDLRMKLFSEHWSVLAVSNLSPFRKHKWVFDFSKTFLCLPSLFDHGSMSLYSPWKNTAAFPDNPDAGRLRFS